MSALLACACGPSLPPVAASSAHVRLHSDRAIPGGYLEWLEANWVAYATVLEVPDDGVIDYFDLASVARTEAVCDVQEGGDIAGCTVGHDAYSSDRYFPHEIVHAMASYVGQPPPWLAEGVAEALGAPRRDGAVSLDPAIEDWMTQAGFENGGVSASLAHYPSAASWTRFLITRFGSPPVMALYRALPIDASLDEQRSAFEATFGQPLDELVAAWLATGPTHTTEIVDPLPECALPPLESGRLTMAAAPCPEGACEGVSWAMRTVDVGMPTRLSIRMSPVDTPRAVVALVGCAARVDIAPMDAFNTGAGLVSIDLLPGRYGLRTSYFPDTVADVAEVVHVDATVTLEPGPTCNPSAIDLDGLRSITVRPGATEAWDTCPSCVTWYALTSSSGARGTLRSLFSPEAPTGGVATAWRCDTGCADLATCTAVTFTAGAAALDVPAGATVFLALSPAGPPGAFAAGWTMMP